MIEIPRVVARPPPYPQPTPDDPFLDKPLTEMLKQLPTRPTSTSSATLTSAFRPAPRPDLTPDEVRPWVTAAGLTVPGADLPALARAVSPLQATLRKKPETRRQILQYALQRLTTAS